jgi:hypothetical protein
MLEMFLEGRGWQRQQLRAPMLNEPEMLLNL